MEYHITTEISNLAFSKSLELCTETRDTPALGVAKRRAIPQQYMDNLRNLVVDNPGIIPRACGGKLIEVMTIK